MAKKILAICAALMAFAVVPAVASASPELQTSGGAKVEPGTGIKGTASNTVLTTSSGNVTCQTAEMNGTVTKNTGTEIGGEVTSASFTGTGTNGRCTSTISDLLGGTITAQVTIEHLPWCLTSTGGNNWTLGPCDGSPISFILHIYTHFGGTSPTTSCTYERPDVSGTFNTNVSPLLLTVGASQTFTKVSGSSLCPSTGTLDAVFTLRTSTGGELKIV